MVWHIEKEDTVFTVAGKTINGRIPVLRSSSGDLIRGISRSGDTVNYLFEENASSSQAYWDFSIQASRHPGERRFTIYLHKAFNLAHLSGGSESSVAELMQRLAESITSAFESHTTFFDGFELEADMRRTLYAKIPTQPTRSIRRR
jgi:hypothetical protein